MQMDTAWPWFPFYVNTRCSRKDIKGPIDSQKCDIRMYDAVGNESLERVLETKFSVRFFTWLVAFDNINNECFILGSYEWGGKSVSTRDTFYYEKFGPFKRFDIRISNCTYFPHNANEELMSVGEYLDGKIHVDYPSKITQIERFRSSSVVRQKNKKIDFSEFYKLGYKNHPLRPENNVNSEDLDQFEDIRNV
jgi:hypothetical protein